MNTSPARVGIVVAASVRTTRTAAISALERLGAEAQIAVAESDEEALRLARETGADLVIRDGDPDSALGALLDGLGANGPPLIAVTRPGRESLALEAFRLGAADCVSRGGDYADVLPVVALEQIRRHRSARTRGRAKRRIRALEELNRAIVEHIPAALVVLDDSLRILAANPEFSRAFGVAPGAVAGRELAEVVPAQLLESGGVRALLRRAADGAATSGQLARAAEPGGPERAFDVRAGRLDPGGRLLLVLSEVTERETLLRRVDDLARTNEHIIQNMNSALLVLEADGRVALCNPMAETILGISSGQLAGRAVWDLFPSTPRERAPFSRTLDAGERFKGEEMLAARPDGTLVPIDVSCAPLCDAAGRRCGAVAIFQDLTEVKELQQQVLQTEKMASIGQLAAGVAHEINNPMGFIHANLFQMTEYLDDLRGLWGRVEALQRAIAGDKLDDVGRLCQELAARGRENDAGFLFADLESAVRESLEGSERIRHIVKDLREFSHQGSDERELADLNQCLDSTANIVWSMMKHAADLTRDYATLPPILCHPMQLKQVFMNLLVNAYQAIQARPGAAHGAIRLRTRVAGDAAIVSVTDNGVGIAPEHRDRIFDPFFTTKEVGVGTGLGLSTAFNIARRHGGTIRVESEPGAGATFELVLPFDSADGES